MLNSGVDNIIKEFFKYCHHDCIQIIVDFLNIVLNTGFIPTEWCLGIITPLYKNRGAVNDPDNYRGITLLSCTGNLFTVCLNHRLSCYVEDNILGTEQAVFRVGYGTIDQIFVLQMIIELYQSVKNVYIVHLLTTVKPLISLIDPSSGRNFYLMKLMGNCLM